FRSSLNIIPPIFTEAERLCTPSGLGFGSHLLLASRTRCRRAQQPRRKKPPGHAFVQEQLRGERASPPGGGPSQRVVLAPRPPLRSEAAQPNRANALGRK